MGDRFPRDLQYLKFSAYGFLKNLRFFEPFMILFLVEQGISFLEVGTLYAIREIAVNILEVPTGAIADGIGRRRTMVASFVAYIVSFVLFWFGSTMAAFVVAMLFFSFGEAFRTGTHKAMIFTYLRLNGLQAHSNDYYGHTRGWSQTGSAVSALIAAAIVFAAGNYRSVFLFSMIPYGLDLLLMLSYPAELDGEVGTFSIRGIGRSFADLVQGVRETVRRPGAVRSVASAAVFAGYFKGSKDYLQPMIAALAVSLPFATGLTGERREAILVGVVYTVIYLLTSVASRGSASVARRLARPERALNWELVAGLLVAIGAGLTRAAGLSVLPVVFFVGIFLMQNLRQPVAIAVVADRVAERVLATVLSAESQLQSVFAALTAFAIGAAAEAAAGNVGLGVAGAAAAGLVALPLLWIRSRPAPA
jgi:MFS family permease